MAPWRVQAGHCSMIRLRASGMIGMNATTTYSRVS